MYKINIILSISIDFCSIYLVTHTHIYKKTSSLLFSYTSSFKLVMGFEPAPLRVRLDVQFFIRFLRKYFSFLSVE